MRRSRIWLLAAFLAASSPAAAQSVTTALAGPGTSDPSPHQLVRTSGDLLYVVANGCAGFPDCGPNRLHVYRANSVGAPFGYTEVGAAMAPRGYINGVAIAIDGADVIHMLWIDRNGPGHIKYSTFDTKTLVWGPVEYIAVTGWTNFTQGQEGVALALDATGTPHAAYSAMGGATPTLRVIYRAKINGAWSRAVAVDNQTRPQPPRMSEHPAIAFAPNGDLTFAWLEGSCAVVKDSTCYTPDAKIYTRVRAADGSWRPTTALPDVSFTTIDNGPSVLITPDGVRHLTFVNAAPGHEDEIRYWYDAGQGWKGDQQPAPQVTHDPVLGPDATGGVFIYGHGAPPPPDYAGQGQNKYYFHKAKGATSWSPWTLLVSGPIDDASSTRWSQFFHNFPNEIDLTYWYYTTPYMIRTVTHMLP